MNFFNIMRASAVAQCRSFFYNILEGALSTAPDEMLEWNSFDPIECERDDEEPAILIKRVVLPMFSFLDNDAQEQYATDAAGDIEQTFGVVTGLHRDDTSGEIIIYLMSAPVEVEVVIALFDDEEEEFATPSHADVGESLAMLTDDDLAFLEFVRANKGELIFEDITFTDDDETALREFFMGDDTADTLEISNDCLEALRNEYDVDEEEEEQDAPDNGEEEEEEQDELPEDAAQIADALAGKTPLTLVPQIPAAQHTDEFEPEAHDVNEFEAESDPELDAASDDFEAEFSQEEREQETEEQDADMGAPDNAHEESFVEEAPATPTQTEAPATAVQPVAAAAPAVPEVEVEGSEFQKARFNRILEDIAAKLPTDTISELEDNGLIVMFTREIDGASKDYVLRVRIAHEKFAGVKMVDMFYVENELGERVLRAPNMNSVVDAINAL